MSLRSRAFAKLLTTHLIERYHKLRGGSLDVTSPKGRPAFSLAQVVISASRNALVQLHLSPLVLTSVATVGQRLTKFQQPALRNRAGGYRAVTLTGQREVGSAAVAVERFQPRGCVAQATKPDC